MTKQETFVKSCHVLAKATRDAADWAARAPNTERLGAEAIPTQRTLRTAARRARKLADAAERKPSVSVYGPSQHGKSWLVSVLARPAGKRLVTDFQNTDVQYDYLDEINPGGTRESTGLVTRFTVTRAPAPAGFPIPLRLLTEADIVRILMNTFRMDGDMTQTPPKAEELSAHINDFADRMVAQPAPGMDEDAVAEIYDYATDLMRGMSYGDALDGFWQEAERIAPRLGRADRAAFLAILWGSHAELTRTFERLSAELDRLGHPQLVHLSPDALVPREASIIDVAALDGIEQPDDHGTTSLRMSDGQTMQIARPLISALGAELELPMRDLPFALMEHVDLLDFPGARSRDSKPMTEQLAKPNAVRELFLRGKVALLFDKYVEDQAITSMMLCASHQNNEVVGLGKMIENWIGKTSGDTPQQRLAAFGNLIFVLTMMDVQLAERGGGVDARTLFQNRVATSFEKYATASNQWVKDWTPGKPFSNSAWLRNPEFPCKDVFEYREVDGKTAEVARLAEGEARVAQMKEGYLAAPLVRERFADPDAAWEAALTPNDGGVSYIRHLMDSTCRPDVRDTQIKARLGDIVQLVRGRLERFHVSSDVAERKRKMAIEADQLIDQIYDLEEQNLYGAFHAALTIQPDPIADRIMRIPTDVNIVSRAAQPAAAAPGASQSVGGRRRPKRTEGAPKPEPAAPATPSAGGQRRMTMAEFQATQAFEMWSEHLHAVTSDTALMQRLGIAPRWIELLVTEMLAAFQHGNRLHTLIATLDASTTSLHVSQRAFPAATICASCFNDFVAGFGNLERPLTERVMSEDAQGAPRPAFAPRPVRDDLSAMGRVPEDVRGDRLMDWGYALKAMFMDNVIAQSGMDADDPENDRLGDILRTYDGETA